jgi:hypothetical protein
MKHWERYEETAKEILNQLRDYFQLSDVQRKQSLEGRSGTNWQIDVVDIAESTGNAVIIECRMTKERQSQEKVAAIAFRIQDVGGERGILVTPKPLQKGAERVAESAGIVHFRLDPTSTTNDFFAEALGNMFIGIPSLGDTSQIGEPAIRAV